MALTDPALPQPQRALRALTILEAGRGILQSQSIETRSDLTALREAHPELADRFAELRDHLDRGSDPRTLDSHESRKFADLALLAADLADTLDHIRSLGGFESFALPPTGDELLAEAAHGPIVTFSVSSHRCDALVLTGEGVTAVPLPTVTAELIYEQIDAFRLAVAESSDPRSDRLGAQAKVRDVLEWIWDNLTGPVLKTLEWDRAPEPEEPLPRIWWAPGGVLSFLPLHAAGHHTTDSQTADGQTDPGSYAPTVMDNAVSSYTPTIRALRHARERHAARLTQPASSLIIGMPTTPGLPADSHLSHVPEEVEAVRKLVPTPLVLLEPEDEPTRDRVLTELPRHAYVHFACHGTSDTDDPSASRLLLHDHATAPLTVASLAPINLARARLAYLSACDAATNASMELLDEAIDLASAFQLAGFPSVVGTRWAIDDEVAVMITERFYADIRDGASGDLRVAEAARALHRAVLRQRDDLPATPTLWASYFHTGV